MIWVADTGPLLHLYQAGLLDLLRYEPEILTTKTVVDEWRRKTRVGVLPEWIRVETPGQQVWERAHDWTRRGLLDSGEAEALAQALASGAGGFLTDDTAAREFARAEGLAVRGSLGVVLMAAARNQLKGDRAREAWDRLANHSTLWLSPTLRREACEALERILLVQKTSQD